MNSSSQRQARPYWSAQRQWSWLTQKSSNTAKLHEQRQTGTRLIHDYSIVSRYQSEFRGVVQYYLLAQNVSHFGKLQWVMGVADQNPCEPSTKPRPGRCSGARGTQGRASRSKSSGAMGNAGTVRWHTPRRPLDQQPPVRGKDSTLPEWSGQELNPSSASPEKQGWRTRRRKSPCHLNAHGGFRKSRHRLLESRMRWARPVRGKVLPRLPRARSRPGRPTSSSARTTSRGCPFDDRFRDDGACPSGCTSCPSSASTSWSVRP